MKEHPILMNGPLVRATLAGLKTQTRRPVQPWLGRNPPLWSRLLNQDGKPDFDWGELLYYGQDEDSMRHGFGFDDSGHGDPENDAWLTSPMGDVGHRLWVRETYMHQRAEYEWGASVSRPIIPEKTVYRADYGQDSVGVGWTPSIHMPRWACRLVLPLVSVRVERVQDITEEDAKAEGLRRAENGWTDGANGYDATSARMAFRELWESIYGTWDLNPWVWVAEWAEIEVSK